MVKKYAIAGASSRALNMYHTAYDCDPSLGKIVGLFSNHASSAQALIDKTEGADFPIYEDFEKMIEETKPDTVIVTTIDSLHDVYIIKAMEMGCDVITEKPLTINEEKTNAILEAKNRTGKKLTITFNFRFIPYNQKVKELLDSGVIGQPLFVNLEYFNDLTHGSSYFRRWHGHLDQSGSLLITKGTHYFDLVDWWLGQNPVAVSAMVRRSFLVEIANNTAKDVWIANTKTVATFSGTLQRTNCLPTSTSKMRKRPSILGTSAVLLPTTISGTQWQSTSNTTKAH